MSQQFLVDINPEIELPKYELILTKLNEEPLCELHNIEDFEIKSYFANIDEISFRVPFYQTFNDGAQEKNELFDSVDGSMMVLVNNMKYFILTKPEIKTNEETGEIYKDILGFSREYELGQKILKGYDAPSRKLYDYSNEKDENGLEWGFLNLIERTTSWKISYINADLLLKYRYLSFPKTTYLQALQEVQRTFGCIFKFNTKDKIIDVYEVTQLGKNQGLYISNGNFLKNLSQTINHDELKTRLFLYGQNNVSIQAINILGKPYIESFNFFKNTRFMSQDLIDALNNYEDYIQTKQGLFEGYLTQLNTKNSLMGTKRDELVALLTELKVIQSNLDVAISSGQSTGVLKTQESTKLSQISTKQIEIDNLQDEIDVINNNINTIAVDTDMTTHFTEAQLRELDPFIREDEYSDSNYTEDNLQELLDEGKKILNRISYPSLQFDVDVEDFLSLVEGQHMWNNFILGDFVTLEHEELGFNYEVRLVGYTHNPDSNKLNLTFSNRNSVDDPNIELKDILEGLTATTNTVDFSRFKWDKGEQANSMISNYINSNLDLEKQKIMGASSQKPLVDERGIWLVKDVGGIIDPEQTRLVNNAIVMTKDNWNTSDIAISPNSGINANLINGKIGNFATLNANQITVGDNGETIPDEALGGSLVKQNTAYNGVKIDSTNGLTVTRTDDRVKTLVNATEGIKIQTKTGTTWGDNFYVDTNGYIRAKNIIIDGTSVSGGSVLIDNAKVRVNHGGGQYSEMRADGFIRKWQNGEAKYLNDIYAVEGASVLISNTTRPVTVWIPLPSTFTGRNNTKVFVASTDVDMSFMGQINSSGSVIRIPISSKTVCRLDTRSYTINWNANPVLIPVLAYTAVDVAETRFPDNPTRYYDKIDFVLFAIGE